MIAIISELAALWVGCCQQTKEMHVFFRVVATTLATLAAVAATPLVARHAGHSGYAGHVMTGAAASGIPSEPADGSVAAIIEIAAMLSADPDTDWTRVDSEGLHEYQVDMNQLVVGASLRSGPLRNGLTARIGMSGRAGEAASRMVPAHTPFLAAETGWQSKVASDGDEIVRTFTAADAVAVARVHSPRFFELIATGDHHGMHHMARGETAL